MRHYFQCLLQEQWWLIDLNALVRVKLRELKTKVMQYDKLLNDPSCMEMYNRIKTKYNLSKIMNGIH